MSRWHNPREFSEREGRESAEARLCDFLGNVRPHLRDGITVASILASHNVSEKVAKYRLALAQDRWAREDAMRSAVLG